MSSHPDVFLGSAVWIQVDGGHPAFILSDPAEANGTALFIRFTSYRPDRHASFEVFTPEDFAELRNDSVVAYYGAKAPDAVVVQGAINDGSFKLISPLPPPVLLRIVQEAKEHDDFSPAFLKFLPPEDHPSCDGG